MQDFFIKEHPVFGKDFHSYTATKIFSIIRNNPDLIISNKDKKERDTAKSMTFKLFYGGSAFTIAQDLGIELEDAEKFVNAYFEAFPGLAASFESAKKSAVEKGWVDICLYTKKRYFFPEFDEMKDLYKKAWTYFPKNYQELNGNQKKIAKAEVYAKNPEVKTLFIQAGKLKGKLERLALNYIIQGSSSVMMKFATILVEKQTKNLKEGIILLIHDEALAQYKEEEADLKNKFVEECMQKAGTFFSSTLKMSATGAVGNYWIH